MSAGATVPTHGYATALHVLRDRWERLQATAAALDGLPAFPETLRELSAARTEIADAIYALEKIAIEAKKSGGGGGARVARKASAAPDDAKPAEKKRRGRPPKARADAPPPELFASEFAEGEDGGEAAPPPVHHDGNGVAVALPEA